MSYGVLMLSLTDIPTEQTPVTLVNIPNIEGIPDLLSQSRTIHSSLPSQDRSSVNHHGRPVVPRRSDHASRHVLVTRRDQDSSVISMRFNVHLQGIGDNVSTWKRVEHAVVAHADVVTVGKGRRSS
jgi:hypothetical protein